MANIVEAVQQYIPKQELKTQEVVPMRSEADMERWERLDDVIMGGQSSSAMKLAADGSGAVWGGDLIVEVRAASGTIQLIGMLHKDGFYGCSMLHYTRPNDSNLTSLL